MMVSFSTDIKVWNNDSCTATLSGHAGAVNKVKKPELTVGSNMQLFA